MATHTTKPPHRTLHGLSGSARKRSIYINAILVVGAIYVLGWQSDSLAQSLAVLKQVDAATVVLAAAAVMLSYVVAATGYQLLAVRRVAYRSTIGVQIASGFTNRLLPAGLGGLGLFAAYMRRQGHTLPVASAIVATNNILGIIGNSLLITAILLARPDYIGKVHIQTFPLPPMLLIIGSIVLAGLLFVIRGHVASRIGIYLRKTVHAISTRLAFNTRTVGALVCNMAVTSLNVLTLSLSVSAAHGSLAWPAALLVLSLGTAIGAAIPTPGGLGGVEAGLLAGMVAFGIPASIGVAAVIVYRLLTYWLPIIPGIIAFRIIEKRLL